MSARRRWPPLVVLGLVLIGCAPAGSAPPPDGGPATRTMTLRIHYSRFSPERIEVPPGTTVRFVVDNADPIAHELIVGDQATQDRHEHGTEAHHGARDGEVSVGPGDTAHTSFTFTTPGTLLFGCHLPGHWDYGMRGTIVVA